MTLATRLSRASLRNISFARARFQSTTSAPPVAEAANAAAAPTTPKQKIQSSVPEGTPLKGLNYLKGAPEVKALADEAYPEWLWELAETPATELRSTAKQAARQDRRQSIRAANFTSAKK